MVLYCLAWFSCRSIHSQWLGLSTIAFYCILLFRVLRCVLFPLFLEIVFFFHFCVSVHNQLVLWTLLQVKPPTTIKSRRLLHFRVRDECRGAFTLVEGMFRYLHRGNQFINMQIGSALVTSSHLWGRRLRADMSLLFTITRFVLWAPTPNGSSVSFVWKAILVRA